MSKETPLPLTGAGRPAPSLIIPYTNTSPGVPPLLVHTAPVLRALLLLHVSTYHTLADVVHTLASSSRPGMQCRPCFSFIASDRPVPRAHLPYTRLSIVRRAIVPAVRRRGVLNTLNDTAGTGDPVYPPRFIGHRSRCTYFEPLLSHSTIPSWFTASCCCGCCCCRRCRRRRPRERVVLISGLGYVRTIRRPTVAAAQLWMVLEKKDRIYVYHTQQCSIASI